MEINKSDLNTPPQNRWIKKSSLKKNKNGKIYCLNITHTHTQTHTILQKSWSSMYIIITSRPCP